MIKLIMLMLNILMLGEATSESVIVEAPKANEVKIVPIMEDYAKVGGGKNDLGDAAGKYQKNEPVRPYVDYIDGEVPELKPIEVVKGDGTGTRNGEIVLED